MSAEPTVEVLRERLKALEERLTQHEVTSLREAELVETAVERARQEVDRRLEAMNELRRQVTDERGMYVTRDRMDANIQSMASRIEIMERAWANLTGRLWSLGVGLGIVVILANLLIRFVWK